MALPLVNEAITYNVKIPSTKENVEFRPFLVKEEKVLLQAYESQDQKQILRALRDTIISCSFDKVDINNCTMFDVEYIFTQLRAKSVGETSEIKIMCTAEECEEYNEVVVDLSNIEVTGGSSKKIPLSDNFNIIMKYPSYNEASSMADLVDPKVADVFDIITRCIEAVEGKDTREEFADYSVQEVEDWIGTLNSTQLKSLFKFVTEMPALKYDVDFTCDKCGHENKVVLEGLQDFF